MRSGKSKNYLNPSGTEWHHDIEKPDFMELLRRSNHRDPEIQDVLHPGQYKACKKKRLSSK